MENFVWPSNAKCFLVEENLQFDRNGNKISEFYVGGKAESIGVSFDNGCSVGWPCEQLLKNKCEFIGGLKYYDVKVSQILMDITVDVIRTLGISSQGGFDFIVQKFGENDELMKIFLIDMNVGRNTANHQSFCVMNKFGINGRNVCFIRKNIKLNANAKFCTLMAHDQKHGNKLLFNGKSKKGVFTHAFCVGEESVITVIADTREECNEMLAEYDRIANQKQL